MRPPRQSLANIGFSVREISERAARHEDAVRFDIGQPDFGTPPVVKERVQEVVADHHITYTSLWGIDELRETIADQTGRDDIAAEHVMVTTGGMGALYSIINGLVDTGDNFLVNDPSWAPYRMIAASSPGTMKRVPYFTEGNINEAGIRDAITGDTVLMIINTPENPTGRVYTPDHLETLTDIASEHDLYIVGDEVYDRLLYGDATHTSPARFAPDRTFIVNSLSKNFAMTGWRLGWLTFPDAAIVEELGKVTRATTACPNYLAQQAALIALEEAGPYADAMVAEYQERRDIILDRVQGLGWDCVTPNGAIYAFPDVGRDSWDFANALLDQAGVSVVPGEPFGSHSDTHVRFCFGSVSTERLQEGFDRIEDFLARA